MSANRAPPAVAPDDGGGSSKPPGGSPSNPTSQSTRRRTGFSGAEQGARSASPTRSRRRFDPSPASLLGLRKQLEPRRAAPDHRPSPSRSVESGRPGWLPFRGPLRSRERLSSRDAPNFQANKPTFQRTSTRASRRFPSLTGFHPGGPASVALHDASLASDHQSSRGESAFCSDSAREQAFL
jgi:hypothetical protein